MTSSPTTTDPLPRHIPEPSGTAALLIDDAGRYLLHLRDAHKPIWRPGHWACLGGHNEPGETCDQGIARELREEIGLHIPDLAPFIAVDTLDAAGSMHDRVMVYLGTLNQPAHEIPLREGVQLRWTHAAETAHMTMDPGTAAVIHAHQANPLPRVGAEGRLPTVRVREAGGHRDRSVVGAHLVLISNGAALLGKRHPGSAFAPSTWHTPAGHREQNESALACMIRETAEETGLAVTERDLTLVHTVDLLDPGSPTPRIQLFFAASDWEGEPTLREPDRCTEWRWWPLASLPDPTVEYTRVALEAISRGAPYTAMGWT
ncbi:NUDIX domain-containing protein [Streptomyces sp. NPDC085927]|uniref:NUDIX hydrolase n=1 Tax=Streptomyces sp. NPDC085927 TaxID=3365738 RepID=UPI0037D00992